MTDFLSYLLFYLVPVIGGIAVYLAMPGRARMTRIAPMLLGAIAIGATIAILCRYFGHSQVMYYVLAVLSVVGAARVVTHGKPVYSAVYFILLVVSVAGIAVLIGAEFLAAALVIIYAGAILVVYVFVIMLAQQPTPPEYDVRPREPLFAVLAGFVLIASLSSVMVTTHTIALRAAATTRQGVAAAPVQQEVIVKAAAGPAADTWAAGNTLALGKELMTTYAVAFEAAGLLLLVGIIGGIALATRRWIAPADETSGGAA